MDAVRSTAFRSGVRIVAPALFLLSVAWSPAAPASAEPAPPPPAASRVVPPAVLPDGARVSERLFGLPGLENVGRVAPGILRGAQPRPAGYKTLKSMGIRTVISLRSRHGESRAVEAAGMRSIELPMNALADVDAEAVREAVAIMTDPANLPVFVHCAHGQDRTGVVVAVYRMDVDGWKKAAAEEEMQAFGFNDIWTQLKDFVRRYPAKAKR
jgi:protein tyrosine/serine phosphatase